MGNRKQVQHMYQSAAEAFFFIFIYIITFVVPNLVNFQNGNVVSLQYHVLLAASSGSMLNTFIWLYRNKKPTFIYWLFKGCGILIAAVVMAISFACIYKTANSVSEDAAQVISELEKVPFWLLLYPLIPAVYDLGTYLIETIREYRSGSKVGKD